MRLGRVAKLTEAEIEAVSGLGWEASGRFDERERAAIRWADRVTRNEAHADADAWEEVRRVFTWPEVVELTLAACLFNFLNRFNDTMWLELDDGAPPNANLFVEPDAFRRYAEGMFPDGDG